jgi:hypothetical protein
MGEDKDRHLVFVIPCQRVGVFRHIEGIPSHHHRAGVLDGFSPRLGLSPGGQVGIERRHATITIVDESVHGQGRA